MKSKNNLNFQRETLAIESELARVARERLEFDKSEAASKKKFWKMEAGTRSTLLLSAAAVIVTLIVQGSAVLTSWIGKEKEIRVSANQRQVEQEKLQAQQKREWDLALAQFVVTHQKAIFNGTPDEKRVLANIIPTIFPQDVSLTLLERLEKTTPPPSRAIWTQARVKVETSDGPDAKQPVIEVQNTAGNSKSTQGGVTFSSTLPTWVLTSENSRYDSSFLDKINSGITTGGNLRSYARPSVDSLNLDSLNSPALSDLIYRPPSTLDASNMFDPSKSLPLLSKVEGATFLGVVIDSATGKGIPGATVEVEPRFLLNGIKATTDNSGSFSITVPSERQLSSEAVKFRIDVDGYKSTTKEVKGSYITSTMIPVSLGNVVLEKGLQQ